MELATIELWKVIPKERDEDQVSLKSFEMIIDRWMSRALPNPSAEEFEWTTYHVLNTLYEVRKMMEETESYRHCEILFVKESKLFDEINEPTEQF